MYALCCKDCFPEHKKTAELNIARLQSDMEISNDLEYITVNDTSPEYCIMVDDSERYCKCHLKDHLRARHDAWVAGYTYDYEQPFEFRGEP